MNQEDFLVYIAHLLNIKLGNSFIDSDIREELNSISDKVSFKNFIKTALSQSMRELEYKTGIEKFIYLCEKYKNQLLSLSYEEQDRVTEFCDKLYTKLSWYFDELKFKYPTKEQLKVQIWKTHIYENKEMISQKEEKVCDMIGSTYAIYQMVSQNKPSLKAKIREIVDELAKQKKSTVLNIGYNSQLRLNQ